jgi:glycosyltransferase involved in cell wall biosynthesis
MKAAGAQSVSVLICTYNRAALLGETLAALNAAQPPPDCTVEIIVVDNNSTDDTRAVVEQAVAESRWPIRYALELQQGKSYALNRGLALASGDILALTDDDVLPDEQWLVRIVGQFRTRDVVFVFGKVLPRWEVPPPPEMLTTSARDIWGPLALIDYGDEPLAYDAATFGTRRLPIGANLAIRRAAVEQVGAWRTDLGKVDNSLIAGEDHELCVRLFQAGLYDGVYDPAVVVQHFVPRSRLRRSYFRRWFYWHGRTMARMSDAIFHEIDLTRVPHVAGVPRFVYREFLAQVVRWIRCVGRSDALALLKEEVQLIDYLGFFREVWFGRGDRGRRTPVIAPQNLPAAS